LSAKEIIKIVSENYEIVDDILLYSRFDNINAKIVFNARKAIVSVTGKQLILEGIKPGPDLS